MKGRRCKAYASEVFVFSNNGDRYGNEEDRKFGTEEDFLKISEKHSDTITRNFGNKGNVGFLAEGRRRHIVCSSSGTVNSAITYFFA